MEQRSLRVERRGPVTWITLDREARRNAITDAMALAIAEALARAEAEDARAVVLTGAGERAFCAGADLAADSGSFRFDFSRPGAPLVRLLRQARDCPLPLIARINGHVMAGGMGLVGMCDLAVAADHARFGLPEVRVGLFPMQVMTVLHRLLPPRVLAEMALTGEPIDAAEALRIGLVNHVVPAAELDAKVEWLLDRLLDKSPTGIRRGKRAVRQIEGMTFEQSLALMEAEIGILSQTEDAAEGRTAFIEKRPPRFSGR